MQAITAYPPALLLVIKDKGSTLERTDLSVDAPPA